MEEAMYSNLSRYTKGKNIFSLANSTLSWLEIIFDISYENWSQSLLIGFSQRKSIIEDIEWNLSTSLRKKGCNKVRFLKI